MSLITLIVVGIGALTLYSERRLLLKSLDAHHQEAIKRLVKVCEESAFYQDDLLLLNYLRTLQSEGGFKAAYFTNTNNFIRVHSDPSKSARQAEAAGPNDLVFQKPVTYERRAIGNAVIVLDKTIIDAQIRQSHLQTLKQMGLIMLAALFIGFIGSLILARTMVKPIQALVQGMHGVSEGKLEPLNLKPRRDELGWLGDELNVTIGKLKELDDMKQNFFSRITHELRSPLIAIDGLVSMILKGMYGETSTKIKELLLSAQNNSARLKRLVDDLLTAARLEAKREEVDPVEFDLKTLINDVHTLYTPLAQEKGLTFTKRIPLAPLHVWAEEEKVQHIMTNLLSNAFKFTKTGDITIEAQEKPKHVQILIADTGMGIPKDEQGKVFDKFFRTSASKKIKGTGLGLTIVKDLVEIQGGTITVAARSGGGTIFSFTLPKPRAF